MEYKQFDDSHQELFAAMERHEEDRQSVLYQLQFAVVLQFQLKQSDLQGLSHHDLYHAGVEHTEGRAVQ